MTRANSVVGGYFEFTLPVDHLTPAMFACFCAALVLLGVVLAVFAPSLLVNCRSVVRAMRHPLRFAHQCSCRLFRAGYAASRVFVETLSRSPVDRVDVSTQTRPTEYPPEVEQLLLRPVWSAVYGERVHFQKSCFGLRNRRWELTSRLFCRFCVSDAQGHGMLCYVT